MIRSVNPRKSISGDLSYGTVTVHDDQAKSNLLNEYFSSCFNHACVPSHSQAPVALDEDMLRFDCTPGEAEMLLRGIKSHTATGPDEISSWMLRTFSNEFSSSISSLFKLSIGSGRLPVDWKLANIVPIPKVPSSQDVRSFRPISLLSILSKCLERHIYKHLLEHLQTNNILTDSQFGFRNGRSTVLPLLTVVNHWHLALEKGNQAACVYFDYKKAFDSIPHGAIINKLQPLQIPPILTCWLTNYLSSRLQRVVLEEPVHCGSQ